MQLAQAVEILGVKLEELDRPALASAFKKLVKKHHPDHGGTAAQFQAVVAAKNVVLAHLDAQGVIATLRGGPRGNCRACGGTGRITQPGRVTLKPFSMMCVLCSGTGMQKEN